MSVSVVIVDVWHAPEVAGAVRVRSRCPVCAAVVWAPFDFGDPFVGDGAADEARKRAIRTHSRSHTTHSACVRTGSR